MKQKEKRMQKTRIIQIVLACSLIIGGMTLFGCGGDIIDGTYNVTNENVWLGGGGDSDSYDADTSGMTVTIEGLEESGGEEGTITLDRGDESFTGTLKNDLSEDDDAEFHYAVSWDNDNAPEVTKNPYGDSSGSTNVESSYLAKRDGEITLQVTWMYSNILYYSGADDIYSGNDTYTLEKQ